MTSEPRYNSYRAHLRKKFGGPVLRIPVNAGFSCPNRDGTLSWDGCSFCDNRSFSPVAGSLDAPVDQVLASIRIAGNRYRAFIPYFQPFSNTYGDCSHLKKTYEPLLSIKDVVGLAIGTRPDCFSDGVADYLGELARRTYMCVELGLQSSHDVTLRSINRGHTFADFVKTSKILAEKSVEVVAHVILGLPGENREMMLSTAEALSHLPIAGIKIHQLMIVAGTALEQSYHSGTVNVLSIEEYGDILCEFLARLRPDQHIHRIMADSKTETGLIAPTWCADKTHAMQKLNDTMRDRNLRQGALFTGI